jgi:hypothetical protein
LSRSRTTSARAARGTAVIGSAAAQIAVTAIRLVLPRYQPTGAPKRGRRNTRLQRQRGVDATPGRDVIDVDPNRGGGIRIDITATNPANYAQARYAQTQGLTLGLSQNANEAGIRFHSPPKGTQR